MSGPYEAGRPVGDGPMPHRFPDRTAVGGDDRLLPWTGMTLGEARAMLTGLHFAKESLSDEERGVLYVAEGLLRLIDGEAGAPGAE